MLASGAFTPRDLVTDSVWVYFTSSQTVSKVKVGGSMVVTLASMENTPTGLAIDPTYAYWADPGNGRVSRIQFSGGAATVGVLTSAQQGPKRVAVDATHVYFTDGVANTVNVVSVGGGASKVLAANQNGADGIAVDAQAIYWTATGAGTVMKLAK